MFKNTVFKGVFLVGLGAISYGVLATFVKMAYNQGYTTAEISCSQFILGIIGLLLINLIQKKRQKTAPLKTSKQNILKLMIAGTSMGFTSIFYYLSVKYIPVSICIVLLMQTVWMGVLLEMILTKMLPSLQKIISVLIVLVGTILATNLVNEQFQLNYKGFLFGILAAASFTATMFTAHSVVTTISTVQRTLYMLLGGTLIVLTYTIFLQNMPFDWSVFPKWGLIVAVFGTILPPILMNSGFPLTGIGLGSIISALELPVSVLMAYFLLEEEVNTLQWLGILLIIIAILLMNLKNLNKFHPHKVAKEPIPKEVI
ncbi:DMT family transporter [Flavobacterium sp. NG2]|uniref:DMT family transporter n=1 Tax=Flavobacterium sp. NG2 TaxID=3097547 RepID=UPI002A7EA76B|nr:DMT family transporter [Flavobacterium sp. NG2]WPR72877.1 DMT family transporter [Flavobacterium sp. NG2]